MALVIIGTILALISITYGIFLLVQCKRDRRGNLIPKFKLIGLNALLSFIGFMLLGFGIVTLKEAVLEWYEIVDFVLGHLLFYAAIFLLISTYFIYFHVELKDRLFRKYVYQIMLYSIIPLVLGGWLLAQGWANHLVYPLVKGISLNPFGVVRSGSFQGISFYAVFILIGALVVLKITDYKLYKQYGKHGIVDLVFIVGLLSGIIGGRLFYVLGELDQYIGRPFVEWIAVWEGGITILGGILGGAVGGVICFLIQHRNRYNIWLVADIAIPAIFLAQAIGRWGNFFNIEVYGHPISIEGLWFVPRFIQLQYDVAGPGAASGMMYMPLFLIEGLLNVAGYFIITLVIKRIFRKYYKFGDLAFLYVVFYGIIRACLEPIRDTAYIMGGDNIGFTWSSLWAYGYILVGILGIVGNHLIRRFILKEKAMNQRYKVLIFDMDGTIANTDQMINVTYRTLYKKYRPDFEPTDDYLLTFSGPATEETLKREFPGQDQKDMFNEYLKVSKENYEKTITLYENQLEVLKTLKQQGYKLAIDTNKETSLTKYTLELFKMETLFDFVVGLNDVKHIKPNPEGVDKIIQHFGVKPSEVLFVGDTKYDYLTSKNAGIDCALFIFRGKDDPAREINSRYHYDSFDGLLKGLSRE
ncbi:MAG: HAD-IA family hydrolase [Erysipelotrichaceae bacterium]|jgi:prolipoprotein diacylglyceryl transferase|nr:HAD-IA family hydrolase [Erysipelotrichaceae bacterium]